MTNKGQGGFKGAIVSGFSLILVLGLVFGWAKVNNITNIDGAYDYFNALSNKVDKCSGEKLDWDCDSEVTKLPGGTGEKNGSQRPEQEKNEALSTLSTIAIAEPQNVSYKRSEWKHWIGTPCDTRKKVLVAQGKNVKVTQTESSCKIVSGTWVSPYDAKETNDQKSLDIDHVIPLGFAAKHGGQSWDAAKKQMFANDMTQLLAVTASENRSKSDKGPGEYMPTQRGFQCQYSKIWVTTAKKYGVTLGKADVTAIKSGLQKC